MDAIKQKLKKIVKVEDKALKNPILDAVLSNQTTKASKIAKGIIALKYYKGLKTELQPIKEYYDDFLNNECSLKKEPENLSVRIGYFADKINNLAIRLQYAELADMKKDMKKDYAENKYSPFNDPELQEKAEQTLQNFKVYSERINDEETDKILPDTKAGAGIWAG